jgi:phospholipase C
MTRIWRGCLPIVVLSLAVVTGVHAADSSAGLGRVRHILVLMQENHSFDNYFGMLPYVPGGPYHPPARPGGPCADGDHLCVDGLTCGPDASGAIACTNQNPRPGGGLRVFHETQYCTGNPPHEWVDAHREANFEDPNSSIVLADGFVRVRPSNITAIGYYTQEDLPYYYALAETFATNDAHFASIIGPTMPNRAYLMAATSFGHVLTSEVDNTPPSKAGYRPITGSVFDLFDKLRVSWTEYYGLPNDKMTPPRPYGSLFRDPSLPNFKPIKAFFADARAGTLPSVAFISLAQHEHPPLDVRDGEYVVATVVAALRASPNWKDSLLFLTYDENGGYYDHVRPPAAPPPDSIPPGQCADLSNLPASEKPGGGAGCAGSAAAQGELCAMAKVGERCAGFDQLGFRDPLVAISPFARPHYVSHVKNDQTAILALIEDRFLGALRLTARDAAAGSLLDMFDFIRVPSLNADVPTNLAPAPRPNDPGCAPVGR